MRKLETVFSRKGNAGHRCYLMAEEGFLYRVGGGPDGRLVVVVVVTTGFLVVVVVAVAGVTGEK